MSSFSVPKNPQFDSQYANRFFKLYFDLSIQQLLICFEILKFIDVCVA